MIVINLDHNNNNKISKCRPLVLETKVGISLLLNFKV